MAVEVESGAYMNQVDGDFSHNPLHDLESLWWVGVWFLLCHYEPSQFRVPITVQQHIEVVKTYGETLFNNRLNLLNRRHALTGSDLLYNIEPLSFRRAIQPIILMLDMFREQLVAHYKLYKPNATQDQLFFNPGLHRKFFDLVEEARNELMNDQTPLWLMGHIERNIAIYNAQ